MRLMSFSLTTAQVLARTKTVTRRLGWRTAKPGDRVVAVEKAMGLKKGEHPRRLAVIEFVNVRREPLIAIMDERGGVEREGFPDLTAWEFIHRFCSHMQIGSLDEVTRIEFRYAKGA